MGEKPWHAKLNNGLGRGEGSYKKKKRLNMPPYSFKLWPTVRNGKELRG